MLLRVSLENWMSFKDRVTFSMIASRERQHGERVPRIDKYQTKVLPIAALYGGNASGKTNFFKALKFVQTLVVKGTRMNTPILVEPFKLDKTMTTKPSSFTFELLIGEDIYEFSFAVTRKEVVEERMVLITATSERELYHRRRGEITLGKTLDRDTDSFLEFAFRGTRDNQLYLTNAVSQNIDTFKAVYDWFANTLELIAPDSRFNYFERFLDTNNPLYPAMKDALAKLDTGIASLGGEQIPFDHLQMSDEIKADLLENLEEGGSLRVSRENAIGQLFDRFVITRKDGELQAQKLVTYHRNNTDELVQFEMHQESDGTQRIIDLLPSFIDLTTECSPKVYVIDEIGRSLHTLLIRRILESYLMTCSPTSRSQLLLTTHDVLLMDQQLFRRDEMWVAERDSSGASTLIPFSDYKDIRYDKDIRKSYLQGRLGGVPKILLEGVLAPPCPSKEKMERQ